jgi:hypothetical protein
VKKPAKPARKGINPFTKQEQTFAAKPASKSVRARPVKAIKDAVVPEEAPLRASSTTHHAESRATPASTL